jgi:hypothetical protein
MNLPFFVGMEKLPFEAIDKKLKEELVIFASIMYYYFIKLLMSSDIDFAK